MSTYPQTAVQPGTIQTEGLEFIEFAATNSLDVEEALTSLGFVCVADHRHKDVRLYRQHDINFIVNAEPQSFASEYAHEHGASSNAMAFRVPDVKEALECARKHDLDIVESTAGPMELEIPAIKGVGGSLIYLVDRFGSDSIYDVDFSYRYQVATKPGGCLTHVDHITQNVREGELNSAVAFYKRVFGFRELQTFDIHGKHSGLASVALISACGNIKIPVNEPTDPKSQIAEFVEVHRGGGVQHIALHTTDIYRAVETCTNRGTVFQPTPKTYYQNLAQRNIGHQEIVENLERLDILIDGSRNDGVLLQIFTQDMIGPVFFELIQRKGNTGFGEGNFQALFESIEREQEERGHFSDVV